jgi:adenosylcobinamide kinase/adenosylcobinamide-phosphate guanylyltransferase
MGRFILITGGARSGKSKLAEEMAKSYGNNILYIATAIGFDEEMKERIRRHRQKRPASWNTIEAYRDFGSILPALIEGRDAVLLDCVTNMVSNIMLEKAMDWENLSMDEIDDVEKEIEGQMESLLTIVRETDIPFIFVTNELGMGVVPASMSGRAVRDIAGRVNQRMARAADEVHFCISGIPMRIK